MSNKNDNLQKFPDELGTLISIMRDYNFLKYGLKGVARNYDALPGGAMILVAVFDLLTICAKKSPDLRPLHKDLFNVLKSHYHAEVKSLDEAFSLERKPHWRQHSENFARLYGPEIEDEVARLHSVGVMIPESFEIIGQRLARSSKTIESIYYRAKKESESANRRYADLPSWDIARDYNAGESDGYLAIGEVIKRYRRLGEFPKKDENN